MLSRDVRLLEFCSDGQWAEEHNFLLLLQLITIFSPAAGGGSTRSRGVSAGSKVLIFKIFYAKKMHICAKLSLACTQGA